MRKLSNTVPTKVYVPNSLGNCFTFDNFIAWEHFYIDFLPFNKHSGHWGITPHLKNTTSFFLAKPPLNQQTVQALPFLGNPRYILVFQDPPPPKTGFFSKPQKY